MCRYAYYIIYIYIYIYIYAALGGQAGHQRATSARLL